MGLAHTPLAPSRLATAATPQKPPITKKDDPTPQRTRGNDTGKETEPTRILTKREETTANNRHSRVLPQEARSPYELKKNDKPPPILVSGSKYLRCFCFYFSHTHQRGRGPLYVIAAPRPQSETNASRQPRFICQFVTNYTTIYFMVFIKRPVSLISCDRPSPMPMSVRTRSLGNCSRDQRSAVPLFALARLIYLEHARGSPAHWAAPSPRPALPQALAPPSCSLIRLVNCPVVTDHLLAWPTGLPAYGPLSAPPSAARPMYYVFPTSPPHPPRAGQPSMTVTHPREAPATAGADQANPESHGQGKSCPTVELLFSVSVWNPWEPGSALGVRRCITAGHAVLHPKQPP